MNLGVENSKIQINGINYARIPLTEFYFIHVRGYTFLLEIK